MLRRAEEWLSRVPTEDPFERRSAVVVQLFCIGLSVLLAFNELSRIPRLDSIPSTEAYSVFANWGSVAASIVAVVLIRRGRTRTGFVVVLGSYLAILAGSLVLRGLGYHEHLLSRVFWILLVLPALLLGRRALWTAFAVLLAAMLAGHLRDGAVGALSPSVPPLGIWGQAIAVMLLLAVILDRFGAALREAYSEVRLSQAQVERAFVELTQANRALADEMERRARAESLLVQSQKLEAIGRLSGGIAHDVNNVLTAVVGFAELARKAAPPDSEISEDLDGIVDSALRAGDLTRSLLSFARRRIVEPRHVTLNAQILAIAPMLRRLVGEGLRIDCRFAEPAWTVHVDPGQLDQVLVNLAVNARDASPGGGTLTFATEHVVLGPDDDLVVLDLEAGEHVKLEVTDTGTGMDSAALASAFEPFFTTKEQGKGTGLGLATCYGIVKQAGGAMRVRSQVGKGSTFEIFLPRSREAPGEIRASAPAGPARSGVETILLVEDDPRVLRVTERTLTGRGYRVLTARDPQEALGVAATHTEDIALLLTDVVLPGTNGRALAREIRARRPTISVLYVSGYSHEVIAHHGVLDPGIDLLPKPFTPDELVAKVREVLERRGAGAADERRSAG